MPVFYLIYLISSESRFTIAVIIKRGKTKTRFEFENILRKNLRYDTIHFTRNRFDFTSIIIINNNIITQQKPTCSSYGPPSNHPPPPSPSSPDPADIRSQEPLLLVHYTRLIRRSRQAVMPHGNGI